MNLNTLFTVNEKSKKCIETVNDKSFRIEPGKKRLC